jgi:hypothetical protein
VLAEGAEAHDKRTGPRVAKRPSPWRLAGALTALAAMAGAVQVAFPAGAAAGQGVASRARDPRPIWVSATTSSVPGATTTTLGQPYPKNLGPQVPDNCGGGTWDIAPGTPISFHPELDAAYLWQGGGGGWTLDVTHTDARQQKVFSGSITAVSGTFVGVTSAGFGNDIVYLSADKRIIYFRFVNFGVVDGLGFTTHCTSGFVVKVLVGGRAVPPRHEFLGADGHHPQAVPVRVSRKKS